MKRIAMLLTLAVLAVLLGLAAPVEAQTAAQSGAKPKSQPSQIVPMHPHQLTLYPHGRPKPPRLRTVSPATASTSRARSTTPSWASDITSSGRYFGNSSVSTNRTPQAGAPSGRTA
jgi:hypothetical protein